MQHRFIGEDGPQVLPAPLPLEDPAPLAAHLARHEIPHLSEPHCETDTEVVGAMSPFTSNSPYIPWKDIPACYN